MNTRLRRIGSLLLAPLLALAAVLWVASGALLGDRQPEARKEPAHLAAMQQVPQVRVRTQTAEPRIQTVVVQARTKADRKVTLRAEARGPIAELLADEGDTVAPDDLLARIDPEDKPARLQEARARLEQRRIELAAARQLSEKGYRAETNVAAAQADYDEAQAQVRQAEEALRNTELRAPFAGRIGARMVEVGDYVSDGAEIMRLVALDPITVVGHVSERNVGKLELGAPARAELVTGETIEGELTFVATEADDATRTFRVEMTAANADHRVRDGVTARLTIPGRKNAAHLVAPSILTLTDEGVVGVKIVDERNRVRFREVDIVSDTPEGMWIAGLPETVTLITVGQNFVNVGQEVEPVSEAKVVDSLPETPLDLPAGSPGQPGPEARP